MGGYDLERVEALLRERAHGLTRTPRFRRHQAEEELPPPPLEPRATVPATMSALIAPDSPPPPPPVHQQSEACATCERPIGMARLRAVPTAIRCIECQLAFEAGARTPEPARA